MGAKKPPEGICPIAQSDMHSDRKWGTPKCHTFPPENPSKRRKPIWVADATRASPYADVYKFTYRPLVDFETAAEFRNDLDAVLTTNDHFSISTLHPDYAVLQRNSQRTEICIGCPTKNCTHTKSFSEIYEVRYSIDLHNCPHCGSPLERRSQSPTGFTPIHDVRLSGRPTKLFFQKKYIWACTSCGRTISGLRIPGLQHVLKGELTLRLIRSLFELSLDKVPTSYVAEGYFLDTNRVSSLSRQFKTRTRAEYQSRLRSIFSGKNYSDFYDEPVYLCGKLFRAIFSADRTIFYAILSEDEITSAYQYLSGHEESMRKVTRKTCCLSVHYCLTISPPLHRTVLLSLLALIDKLESVQTKSLSVDSSLISDLHYFLCEAFLFRLDLTMLHCCLADLLSAIPARFKKLLAQLRALISDIEFIRSDSINWYNEYPTSNIPAPNLSRYYHGEVECLSRLPITRLIETSSRNSDFPLREQLARMQYYNEPAIFPTLPLEQHAFPISGETGWPSFGNTLLGTGIPVKCLKHLLLNGLLLSTEPPPPCVRHRLGLQSTNSNGCIIKECPLLHEHH